MSENIEVYNSGEDGFNPLEGVNMEQPDKGKKGRHETAPTEKSIASELTKAARGAGKKKKQTGPTEADLIRIQGKKSLISKHINHAEFSKYLQAVGLADRLKEIHEMDEKQLDQYIKDINTALDAEFTTGLLGVGINYGTLFIEKTVCNIPAIRKHLILDGWNAALNSNPKFKKLVSRLELQYETTQSVSLELQLICMLGFSAY